MKKILLVVLGLLLLSGCYKAVPFPEMSNNTNTECKA